MIRARFFVTGEPAPQGSKRIVQPKGHQRPLLLEMSKKLPAWRAAVAAEALVARQQFSAPLAGPLAVSLSFAFRRPKKPTRPYPSTDLDKLARAVHDALVHAQLIVDDRQITVLSAMKTWTTGESGCHVLIQDGPA